MVRHTIDNSGQIFGDAVTLADLAANSFRDWDSDALHIYRAAEIIEKDWTPELSAPVEMEHALGISATFKDGSKLHVSAWADCCRPDDDGRYTTHCHWCGNG